MMVQDQDRVEHEFFEKIKRKQDRKIRAQRESKENNFWIGLSMFGLIGWSVVVPTLVLTAIGIWLDSSVEGRISWTVTGIVVGVIIGCLNAWYWIKREGKHED